jgi:tetratricopeptide (TPR) repeat protein
MILTGQQKEILKEGILGAYPNEDELKILLSEKMDLRYGAIARGEDYTSRVAFLVEKLEADGEVEQFIRVVVEKKPNSPYLTQVKTEFENILSQPASPKKNIPSNLRYQGSDHFVGRDEVLDEIGKRLKQDSQLAICAVSGMGGIGKTELAVQYVLDNKNKYPGGICWLECRTEDLGIQIVNYARSLLGLNIPEGLELPEQVGYCWQNWREETALLIYDDVVDYEEIRDYLPPRNDTRFKVLLTSRQRLLDPSKRIELEVLDEEAALKLLRALVRDGRIEAQLEQSKALCEWLGYLPLGLELVGRYLEKNPSVDIVKVQKRLEKSKLEAPAFDIPEGADITGKRNLAAAFQLSWEDEKLTKEARELGCRLSLFATAPINWSLVEACYLGEQVWSLESLEKMKADPDKEAYQDYLEQVLISSKDQGEEIEDIEEVEEKLENWLSEMDEGKQTLETLRVQLSDRSLLQEITQDDYRLHPLIREFLQTKQGVTENIDDCKRDICRVMVAIAQQIPSTVTLEVIQSTTSYIPHLREVGENLMEWVEDEDLIRPFVGLGRIYEGQSQFTEAEKWLKQSVKVMRDRLGERHPSVATSYNNLAGLYESMGRYEEALPLYQQALEISLEQLGERHPSVATSYNNLAALYRAMGRYEEAIAYYQHAINIAQGTLGKNHLNTVLFSNNYHQMLLEAPTEEILKALPEEMHEGYLQWRSDWEKQKEQGEEG